MASSTTEHRNRTETANESTNGTDPNSGADGPTVADLNAPTYDGETLELDEVFHILQNERRRQVLMHLKDVEGTVNMRDIAEQIAAWENDTTVENLYSDQRQRVYIALYQSHLPKLDDLGVIEYNQARGSIEPTPLVEDVTQYLEVEPTASASDAAGRRYSPRQWGVPILSTGVVMMLIVGAAVAGVFPTSIFGVVLASAAIGVTVAASVVSTPRDGA